MEKLAKELGGSSRAKNMVAAGAVCGVISFDTTPIEELVTMRYAHKAGVADANLAALAAGKDEAADLTGVLEITQPAEIEEDRVLMSGNQAIALGAVAAGLDYFAGYPITPASDILEWLSAKLPATGGVTIQMEDEIASLASVIGASYTGAKAATATSGPGPVADERAARLRRDGGDPLRDHRRPARRPVDGSADQDRAVRPEPRPLRRARRGAPRGDRADQRRGLLLGHGRRIQLRREATRCRSSS